MNNSRRKEINTDHRTLAIKIKSHETIEQNLKGLKQLKLIEI
jgi:hypothetical protein